MRIPARQRIIARANDARADANQHHSYDTVRHLDKLISNLNRGMSAKWDADGHLIVRSANTRGAAYTVTSNNCSCPAYVDYCTHRRLRDLILDIQATDAESADMQSDPPNDPGPLGDTEGAALPARSIGQRIAAARRTSAYAA